MQPSPTSVTLKNRFTWVALVLCVISVVVVLSQFGTSAGLGIKAIVIAAGLLSALIWFVLFQNSAEYHDEQAASADAARRREARQIEDELRGLGQTQAADHVHQLSNKLDDYQNVLKMKFGENEMTYQRYMGVGHQLYDGANRNLQAVLASARSVKSIDTERLRGQVEDLNRRGRGDSDEAKAIKDRYGMYVQQSETIDRLVEQNEQALTALSDATTQLAGIDTNAGSTPRMDSMIEDLKRLAEKVDQYGVRI